MTAANIPVSGPGRIKFRLRAKRLRDNRDPGDLRQSWEVFATRFWVLGVHVGYVNAKDRDTALEMAKQRWPRERRLTVYPCQD